MTGRFAEAAGIKPGDFAAAAGLENPARAAVGTPSAVTADALLRARAKREAGKPLTSEEAAALARSEAGRKTLAGIGVALQPFQALSDITKGLIGQARGIPDAANRGAGAAAGHLTYGLAEYLPGATGARARGVSGEELLKGTRYAGNKNAALAVELLADPSLLLAGAGLAAKGGATAGRLAQLEKLGKTPEGAAMIRGALQTANKQGDVLLRAGDEITGVPAVVRGVAKGPVGKGVKAATSKLADTTLPKKAQDVLGVRTVGDAFFTPDMKAGTYTPEQLARDEFRDAVRLGADDTRLAINAEVTAQVPAVRTLLGGLKPADAAEVNRLLGVFGTTTKSAVAAEALRKLTALSQRVGKPLEKPFVAAVKALDNVGQNTTGARLAAENLPAIVDPKIAKQIQAAETGADLLPLVGKYVGQDGRPRGILMTQYAGRADPDRAIATIAAEPEIPALATVDEATLAPRLTGTLEDVPMPPKPVEPVEVAPRGAPPLNPAGRAERVVTDPVNTTAPFTEGAARQPVAEIRSPQAVLEELFGPSIAPAQVAPAAAVPTPAQGSPAPVNTLAPTDFTPPGRTPASVIEETLSPTPRPPEPTPAQGPKYIDLSGMGGAITDNMYDMLYGRYVAGKVDEAGKPSNVLQGAAQLKARGVDLTREQFPDFARDLTQTISAARGTPDFADQMRRFFDGYTPGVKAAPSPEPAPVPTAGVAQNTTLTPETAPLSVTKTPAAVLQDVLSPGAPDPFVALPDPVIRPTPQDDVRALALPTPAPERMVERAVPTTYRTVQVDANALDWAALPDDSARRAVLNSIPEASTARFVRDGTGAIRLDRTDLTVPLGHPIVSRYFADDEVLSAQRTGTDLGERTILRREQVPDWYNPKDPAPLEVQRALREQAQREAAEQAYPNDFGQVARNLDSRDELDNWTVGGAYASYDRLVEPARINTRAAANDYAARVKALTGSPPTRGEVFQYRLALSRYRQAANLRDLNTTDAARHLAEFYRQNPEATLWEGVLSTARAFDLGKAGAKHLQAVLAHADSGFARRMSRLERLEFAQFMKAKDGKQRSVPGGLLIDRLKRRPEEVSREFEQVFPLEVNAVKLLDEQVRTRTAAIVRAQMLREYHGHLTQTGQHLTARQLKELRTIPPSRLDPKQRELREGIARASEQGGVPAGWKIMDRGVGPFEKGDAVPWWAYHDLFGASSVDDAAVGAAILSRGTPGGTYDRAWRSMNAQLLGSPSSILNDQVGQFLQMMMWGVTPDAVIEGMIRRATAKPAELAAMRASGIQSAKLETAIGADRMDLTRLAQRMDGDTDQSRMGRVVDAVLRFRERGTGIDPQAMTGAAGVAADMAHLGSGYLFRARSAMSDLQRESLYFHKIATGASPGEAARFANEVLMDMRLVPAYARVVSKVWPFFNWIAMSGPRSIVTVLRKPGLAAAYQRLPAATDSDDPKDDARRVLARDGGYFNLGMDERGGTRLYLDPRNWDPTNTIPQLLDWSGTKVGAVSLPWWATTITALQWGTDRFGGNIYAEVLDGQRGGAPEAFRADPAGAAKAAARFLYGQFSPSYAPGSPRARAFVAATLETAKLPDDGSRDIIIARALTTTPQGRAYLLYMQSGNLAVIDRDLKGNRGSPYSDAPPSMARAGVSFILPVRGVNADQNVQGTAQQKLSVEMLNFQGWLSGERKRLAELEAAGASRERIHAEEARIEREAARRGGKLDYLDQVTR